MKSSSSLLTYLSTASLSAAMYLPSHGPLPESSYPWLWLFVSELRQQYYFPCTFRLPALASLWKLSHPWVIPCVCVLANQSCPTLCDPSIHRILKARILEWTAISFSRGSSRPSDRTRISRIAGRHFTSEPQSTLCEMLAG